MTSSEIIAYEGSRFAIEWYFNERGRSQALEYFNGLSEDRQDKALMLFRRMGDGGKIFDRTKFRSEGGKIFAFKPQPDRYFCFFYEGRKIVITNAFEKKGDKPPRGEVLRALRMKSDYEHRILRGTYYA